MSGQDCLPVRNASLTDTSVIFYGLCQHKVRSVMQNTKAKITNAEDGHVRRVRKSSEKL